MTGMRTVQDTLSGFDFSDGRIERVQLWGDSASLTFRDWRERLLRLEFRGVVLFKSYEFGGDVTEVQASASSPGIKEALAAIEGNGGAREGYPGLTHVSFLGDAPMIGIVCQAVEIEVIPDSSERR